MSTIELGSGVIKLSNESFENLQALLEVILPYWLKEAEFNGRGILVFLLQDPSPLTRQAHLKKEFPPILMFFPERDEEARKMPAGYAEIANLPRGATAEDVVAVIAKVLADTDRMNEYHCKAELCLNPREGLGQGDGCFPAYAVSFDTYYFTAHLSIILDYVYTPA